MNTDLDGKLHHNQLNNCTCHGLKHLKDIPMHAPRLSEPPELSGLLQSFLGLLRLRTDLLLRWPRGTGVVDSTATLTRLRHARIAIYILGAHRARWNHVRVSLTRLVEALEARESSAVEGTDCIHLHGGHVVQLVSEKKTITRKEKSESGRMSNRM